MTGPPERKTSTSVSLNPRWNHLPNRSNRGMKEIPQQQQTQRHLGSLCKTTETLHYNSRKKKTTTRQCYTEHRKSRQLTSITALLVFGVNQELCCVDWVPRGPKGHEAISHVWQHSVSRSNLSREIVQRRSSLQHLSKKHAQNILK